jgi:DNA polymerase-3 subunit delta'
MKFAEVIGQEEVKKKLIKTVKTSRVSHAQLFFGPQGSGKLALALAYAQYINCKDKQDDDSCGVCPSCIKYSKVIHPDLHFIYPTATVKGNDKPMSKNFAREWRELFLESSGYFTITDWHAKIGIERKQTIINARDCNEIIRTLSYKSYEAYYKVMIIWMVEKLYHAAAPKILKILEEPPDKTLFILASENQEQIINTILSRTQLVKIPPIEYQTLISSMIDQGYDPSLVNDAVRVAGGNYIHTLELINNKEKEEENFNLFTKWMRLCFRNNAPETLAYVSEMAKFSREKQKSLLTYSLRIFREGLLINLGVGEQARMNQKESDFMKKFYPYINSRNGNAIVDELNKSIYHIERNANPAIMFADISLKFGKLLKV